MKHTYYECMDTTCCDNGRSCMFCDGGLASCTVCHGGEASLLPTCPGYALTAEAQEAICKGEIRTVDDLLPEHRDK